MAMKKAAKKKPAKKLRSARLPELRTVQLVRPAQLRRKPPDVRLHGEQAAPARRRNEECLDGN